MVSEVEVDLPPKFDYGGKLYDSQSVELMNYIYTLNDGRIFNDNYLLQIYSRPREEDRLFDFVDKKNIHWTFE